jgi:ERCC4-type nuclease
MKIIVDNRERTLIKLLPALSKDYNFKVTIEVQKLDIGDIVIKDNDDIELLIIERKNLADLASSIKDGRYNEQSFRLTNHPLHNHNIMYLVEGNISKYSSKFSRVKPETLYTTMFSLNYYKGFSVIRTFDISETAEFILRTTDKIQRETKKKGYYTSDYVEKNDNYSSVIQKVKKNNITPDNISTILLSQIPGVSNKTADAIMEKYETLFELMKDLQNNQKCLDDVTIKTTTNQNRKISKTAIENIIQYLICNNSNVIKIET